MKKLILLLFAALLVASPAVAEQKRPLVIKNGSTQQIQAGDTLTLQPSTTGAASLNVPQGTAPSSPNNGDCWTTSAGLYCRAGSVTTGPFISADSSSFLQNGTGAVARSFASKAKDTINVKDFGALCNSNGTTGNGNDDTAAIQAAVTYAATTGDEIELPAGICRTTAQITAADGINIRGKGFFIPRAGSGGATNLPSRGSWLFFDHTGIGMYFRDDASPSTEKSFTHLTGFGTFRAQNTPSLTPATAWTPTVMGEDFRVEGRALFDRVAMLNPYVGIYVRGAGVLWANDLFGQPLYTGINFEYSSDIQNITNIHFWPFWAQNSNVYDYTIDNAVGIRVQRSDGLQISRLFTYAYAWSIDAQDASGVGSGIAGFRFDRVYADKAGGAIRIISNYYAPYGSMNDVLVNSDSAVGGTGAGIDISGSVAGQINILGLSITRAHAQGVYVHGAAHVVNIEPYKIGSWDRLAGGYYAFSADNGATINLLSVPVYSGGSNLYNQGSSGIINYPSRYQIGKAIAGPTGFYSVRQTIADDGVLVIPAPSTDKTATLVVTPVSIPSAGIAAGSYWLRSSASPSATTVSQAPGSSLVDVGTGVLTGTTGTDGHVTIHSANDGKFYIENRFGSSVTYIITVLGN